MVGGFAIGFVASAGIGLSLGLVGAGGSILTVPILVYLLGVPPADAVGVSLAVVAMTSLLGAALQHRAGQVELRVAALFGAVGAVGAVLGSRLTHLLSSNGLMTAFGLLMVVASVVMLTRREREAASGTASVPKAALAGFGTGVVTGFLGVGGGFLVVPALLFFGGLPARKAIGTSLLVIAINSLVGLAAAIGHGAFDLTIAAVVSAAAALGMVVGTRYSQRLSPQVLRRAFAGVALAVAAFVLVRTLVLPAAAAP